MAFDLPQEYSSSKVNLGLLGLAVAGLFLLSIGLGMLFFRSESGQDIQIVTTEGTEGNENTEIMVHVEGAVVSPGLYQISSNGRVNDAILAAGGLTEDADEAKINLAAKVSDGQKIHVFSVGEQGTVSGASTEDGAISINTASASQLDKLPGVGPVTAEKIIAGRPYSSLEELVSKKAVSSSVFEKIKGQITY